MIICCQAVVSICHPSYDNKWIPEVRKERLKRDVRIPMDGSPSKRFSKTLFSSYSYAKNFNHSFILSQSKQPWEIKILRSNSHLFLISLKNICVLKKLQFRSFSHTSLPLPARIQFLLRLKYNFCIKQEHQRELCVDRIEKKMRAKNI